MHQILRACISLVSMCFVLTLQAQESDAANSDDLKNVVWIDQKASTKSLYFRVAFPNEKTEPWQDPPNPVAIEVLDRANSRRLQLIRDFESSYRVQPDQSEALILLDANFDGYPDISIAASDGGAGPNNTVNFFLFSPQTGHFEFNEELSNLTQIRISEKTKTIESAARGSCCQHSSETFRYVRGKLVQISSWDESMTTDGKWIETTNCRLMHSKMRCKTLRKRTPKNY